MIGEKWLSIRNDKKKGLSYSEIARKYNIDRRTAKKYCESNVKPDYKYSNPRKKKIDAYSSYIDELLSEAPYSAVRIQELVEEHFHTFSLVNNQSLNQKDHSFSGEFVHTPRRDEYFLYHI